MKELLKNIAVFVLAPAFFLLLPFMALAGGIRNNDGDDIRSALKMMCFTAVGLTVVFLITMVTS